MKLIIAVEGKFVLGTVSLGIFGISIGEMAVRGDMVIKCTNLKVKKIFAILYRGARSVTHVYLSGWASSNMDSQGRSFSPQSPKEC